MEDCIWPLIGIFLVIGLIYLVIMGVVYAVAAVYITLCFLIFNLFIGLEKILYPGFDIPPLAIWMFWGFLIGFVIQGYKEAKIYGRPWLRPLIILLPLVLFALLIASRL